MATRAASKQQELEEQLAKLVGLVEQQQQRQRQEQLAAEQRQCQELELERQEQLAREQWQRLEELAGEQRRRQGQSEAEQTSTGTKPSPSLRPEATAFIPSSSPLSTGSDSGGVRRAGATQRPPLYDGRSSWDAYVTQFGILAHLNNWNQEEKATLLAVSLRGAALTVLSNLPAERRGNYQALVTALENRFGTAHQAELHRMKLRNRTRGREETLAELMEDIEP